VVFQFFCLFSRFEYALKRIPRFLKDQERAEASWDEYGNSLKDRFASVSDREFTRAVEYLQSSPPQRQVVRDSALAWDPTQRGDGESLER